MRPGPEQAGAKEDSGARARSRGAVARRPVGAPGSLLAVAMLFGLGCGPGAAPASAPSNATSRSASEAASGDSDRGGGATRTSQAGRFEISIRPEAGQAPLGVLHAWIVEVRLPGGEPAAVRQLVFDGGMPQHAHGFETSPRVTGALGPGAFRVDGVRFHMTGDWQIRVDVATEGVADTALFDVRVGP